MSIQEIYISAKRNKFPVILYRIEGVTKAESEQLAEEIFTNPLTERYSLKKLRIINTKIVEIGYKPGVMDPVEASILKASRALGINPLAVSTSRIYLSGNSPFVSQVERVINKKPKTLLMGTPPKPVKKIDIRNLSLKKLESLSKKRSLFLNLNEMQLIQKFARKINRELTDVELETLAQTWSEHNCHKTFKATLVDEKGKNYPSLMDMIKKTSEKYFERTEVISAFADNAGGIRFYEGQVILIKGETHNSPVAVEPYGGSLTKNGGVYRDIAGFGKGGENLAGFMVNCFADPETPYKNIPSGVLPPKHLLLENSRGERDYGNRMGIPTHGISLHFHQNFGPKPTSMGIVIGIIPEKYATKEVPQNGDLLITVGGKTGRDGIHGATFSSGAMTNETNEIHSSAVQIGNAIEEKRMFDALIKCRDCGLIRSITDCGGGGYSSAIGEMAKETGVSVDLDLIPLKYQGLSPWEIWLSESQERMVVAIAPENWEDFKKICAGFDTPAKVIGLFTGDKKLKLIYRKQIVEKIPMDFLHNGLPRRKINICKSRKVVINEIPPIPTDYESIFKAVLSNLNVASVEPMLRQYDQTVQGRSALSPFTGVCEDCPSDASVIAPILGKPYGVVTAYATNPILNRIDPYWGSLCTVVHAFSKFISVGGDISKAAINDNFVSPFPDPESISDLHESVAAICKMMDSIKIPCISGKDSLSSTFKSKDGSIIKIPPLLNVTVFGKIPEVKKTVSSDIKNSGSVLVLVGRQDVDNMGGSVYFQNLRSQDSHVPHPDLENLPVVLNRIHKAINSGKVLSSKAVGEGGLATALAQMCFGGNCGVKLELSELKAKRVDFALFNETPGVFLIEIENSKVANKLFLNIPYKTIGFTTKKKVFRINNHGNELLTIDIDDLKSVWQSPIKKLLNVN
jgi:phosphoribosylformylglycinamidine synthase